MPFANPRGLPGNASLKSYLHLPPNITLFGSLDSSGAVTPNTITLTSSTSLQVCADIRVVITGTGGIGAANATWSINGSTPVAFTVQSSVALAGTPFTLGFPAGVYTSLDSYRSVINSFTDKIGNVWVGDSAAANVLPFIELVSGMPTVRTDGVLRRLHTSTATLSASLIDGIRTPFSLIWTGRYNGSLVDPTNTFPIVSISNGSTGQAIFYFGVNNGLWKGAKRGDSGGTTIVAGSAADNAFHLFQLIQNGTNLTVLVDGVSVLNVAQNVGITLTTNQVVIGGFATTGAPPTQLYADMNWGDHAFYAGVISTTDAGYIRQNFKSLWNTP